MHESNAQQSFGKDASGSFESAKGFLERGSLADSTTSRNQSSHAEHQRQLQFVATWAQRESRLIPPERWTGPIESGAEHRVFYDEQRNCAIKITNTGKCGMTYRDGEPAAATVLEYFDRWILHNRVFDDRVWLEGVIEGPSGISLVIGQSWIKGTVPDCEAICSHMEERGFSPTVLLESYYRREDNLAALDCHEGNFILGADGILYAIDVVMLVADDILKNRMEVLP